jgi:hypothetical protein
MAQQPDADSATLRQVRGWISSGVTLNFVSPPAVVDHENTFSVLEHAVEVRGRIQEYIAFEAIVPLPADHPRPFGIQPLHVIIKPAKKPRLVIDLSRNLNDHLEYQYFSYSSVRDAMELSSQDCWYGKLDLTNCFLSFPLHPSALPHFIFAFEGRLYQFVRMPFGLSSAPRICTQLLSVVEFALQQAGIAALVRYLDDFLLIALSRAASQHALTEAQRIIASFGLVVNPDKTEGPAQRIAFLGIQLDSIARTLSCTPDRIAELRRFLTEALTMHQLPLPFLATLIGKLSFASQVLPGARPFVRSMIDLLHRRRSSLKVRQAGASSLSSSRAADRLHYAQQHATVRADRRFRADVRFWLAHLHSWNGAQRWRSVQSAPFVFASDASLYGFGFYIESTPPTVATSVWPRRLRLGSGFSGTWSPQDAALITGTGQMSWCEMFAVYAALLTYRCLLSNSCVVFYIDNQTDVFVLNKQKTGSCRLAGLLRRIYQIASDDNISVFARHRPGVDNVLADFLSRPALHGSSDIAGSWREAHPDQSARLLSVSIVHSQQFGNMRDRPSSTTSPPSA